MDPFLAEPPPPRPRRSPERALRLRARTSNIPTAAPASRAELHERLRERRTWWGALLVRLRLVPLLGTLDSRRALGWLRRGLLNDCFGVSTPPEMSDAVAKKTASTTPLMSHGSSSPTSSASSPGFTMPNPEALTYETLSAWLRSSSRPPPELARAPPPRFGTPDVASPGDPPRSQATALQHVGHLISEIYTHVVNAGCWDTAFARGPRPFQGRFQINRSAFGIGGGPPVRRLASVHIGHPGTDGWNVIVSATELARRWALPSAAPPLEATDLLFLLDRETRMRVAVALATAWHFHRSSATRFPREYAPDLSHAKGTAGTFSFELARIGYLCLYEAERRRLGPWPIDMVVEMQTCLLDLQIGLLTGAPTFGPMVRNAQVLAEERLFALIEDGRSLLTVSAVLTARAVIPFFVRNLWLSNGGHLYVQVFDDTPALPVQNAAAALVCAAWIVTSEQTRAQAEHVCAFFELLEQRFALAIISAVAPVSHSVYTHTECFASSSFYAAPYVSHAALDSARARLAAAMRAYGEVRSALAA